MIIFYILNFAKFTRLKQSQLFLENSKSFKNELGVSYFTNIKLGEFHALFEFHECRFECIESNVGI